MGPGGMTLAPAGQPGHGRTAFLRRQPARIVDGRFEGGYTGLFELICPGCGDHPYLDYAEIPPRLQWLRGPRRLQAALAAYDKHLGLLPGPNGDGASSLGPHAATKVTRHTPAGRTRQKLGASTPNQAVSQSRAASTRRKPAFIPLG